VLIITALTACVLAVLLINLSLKVVRIRRADKVSVGDGGDDSLLRAIRTQSNLVEYSPIALILLACAELNGVSRILLAIVALAFVAGRVLHPVGMQDDGPISARIRGMQLTLFSILALVLINIAWLCWIPFR